VGVKQKKKEFDLKNAAPSSCINKRLSSQFESTTNSFLKSEATVS